MKTQRALLAIALTLGTGCTPDEGNGPSGADLGTSSSAVVIRFKGVVGSTPFACGQSYPGVGGQTLVPADFRLYVQDLKLLTDSGAEVPVRLDADGKWQTADLALLDFEDKTGECTGTTEVNTQIRGTVASSAQKWSGLRFTVGVPFAQNHQDRATAASPLNLTSMFWSWQSGYKFVRIEGKTMASTSYVLHLGSTGCVKDANDRVTSCTSPNRATITLNGFDPAQGTVAVDLAALLGGSNLSAAAECHSQGDKAECGPFFKALGLPFMGGQPTPQSAFRAE